VKRLAGQQRDIAEIAAVTLPALAILHYASSADDLVKSPTPGNLSSAQTARTLAIGVSVLAGVGWYAFLRK